MPVISSEGYEGASGAAQFIAGVIGRKLGGKFGEALATYLTGQNAWAASVTDLVVTIKNMLNK